jgi:hypothetical protein
LVIGMQEFHRIIRSDRRILDFVVQLERDENNHQLAAKLLVCFRDERVPCFLRVTVGLKNSIQQDEALGLILVKPLKLRPRLRTETN